MALRVRLCSTCASLSRSASASGSSGATLHTTCTWRSRRRGGERLVHLVDDSTSGDGAHIQLEFVGVGAGQGEQVVYKGTQALRLARDDLQIVSARLLTAPGRRP